MGSSYRPFRVAVIGAGPAGLFASEALLEQGDVPVSVDLFDRLRTPFGLVRHGVAPDHPQIKSVVSVFDKILSSPHLRFLGGVEVGAAVTGDELLASYDAVIYTTGAPVDNRLGIPGEDLVGSIAAADLVSWYNGHPDAEPVQLDATAVAVIGAGNVALDVARLLAAPRERLTRTDVPRSVLDALAVSPVTDVHVICRRGPAAVRFSTKELRELGQIDDVEIRVDPDAVVGEVGGADRRTANVLAQFRTWSASGGAVAPARRRIHFRFDERPVEILGRDRVEALRVERSGATQDDSGSVTLQVGMVIRSVGQRGAPLAGLPFDHESGCVPSDRGRVVGLGAQILPRQYVGGWIKRGASGVIGTNKICARESVESLLADLRESGPVAGVVRGGIDELLRSRRVLTTGVAGWRAIDREEERRGRAESRQRSKVNDWETLSRLAREGMGSQAAVAAGQEQS